MISQINKVILKSLESGDKYGLEIIKDIQEFTNNRVVLKQPTLYSALRRMEKKDLISSFWSDSELGGRRHYYSLSPLGRDELRADSEVSESDIQTLIQEVDKGNYSQDTVQENHTQIPAPIIKNKVTFESFDPRKDVKSEQSFTQQVRNSNEPATIQEKPVAKSILLQKTEEQKSSPIPSKPKSSENTSSFWRENLINESQGSSQNDNDEFEFKLNDDKKTSRFEINYKDILGDLDADKPIGKEESHTQTSYSNLTEREEQKQRAKEYSTQLSQFFSSNKSNKPEKTTITKEQEELRNAIFKRQNQSTLDEINRRYNLNDEAKTQTNETITENYSNLTKVSPTDIEVKRYVQNEEILSSNEKEFININKLILTRSIIMAFFFAMSVLISYFVFSERNFIYAPHTCLYWIALGCAVLYVGIVLAVTLPKFNKKIQIKRINWFVNLFYRTLIAVALFTFVIALCLCFGMTNFMQIEFFTIWYISALATGGILVSWLLSYIIFSTKSFRE